jgi:hypothetical protein
MSSGAPVNQRVLRRFEEVDAEWVAGSFGYSWLSPASQNLEWLDLLGPAHVAPRVEMEGPA